jgi:two-component system sensor histidine kinase KdpD
MNQAEGSAVTPTTMNDGRPAPERFLALIRDQQRGRLKVYLGFAAGVGKTYEMLQEGHRLKRQGVDVVVGIVETHGRADTAAQVGDLEQVPRRRIEYRGVVLEEMDLDALLKRRPQVALVDELAHTNAPGSHHAKRYQDVQELLAAGVNVITTMNVQHLESLYDLVEQFTGVKVKERVPDYVLATADQIVNVDLSAEDLQDRLRAGKVYPAERVASALGNFFTDANLTRLRELTLDEVRHLLDRRRQAQAAEAAPGNLGRVMVCLSSRSPNPSVLLRKGARLAERMHAPWYAVHVKTPRESTERLDAATQRKIADSLELAHQLGAVLPVTYTGQDFAGAVSAFVKEYEITHVVLGRTQRPWYRRWFGLSPLDRLLRAVPRVDVLVVDTT